MPTKSKTGLYRLQVYRSNGRHSEYRYHSEDGARSAGLSYFNEDNVYKVKCYYGFAMLFEIV